MSVLTALLIPISIAIAILLVIGIPTDFETAAGANGAAILASLWVAVVFLRRWLIVRVLPRSENTDPLLAWMLLTMTITAVCIGWLLVYRLGYALAGAADNPDWDRWFVENRIVGATITVALAASMIAKLRYPLSRSLGRWWIAIVGSLLVCVFFALVWIARSL